MSFFEVPPRRERPERPTRSPWFGPAEGELPAILPIELTVARTESAVVSVRAISVYRDGFAVSLFEARKRPQDFDPRESFARHHLHFAALHGQGPVPDDLLRFGVEYSDGTKATNVASRPWTTTDRPKSPTIMLRSEGYWIWPLPPPGRVGLLCEWPSEEIGLSRIDVDGDEILAAAARSTRIWE